MTIYVVRGSSVFPQEDADSFQQKLPPATYNVALSIFGWFLERTKDVQKDPARIYGNVETRASRVIRTFEERSSKDRSTGVLLTGVKGSGKTMLARMISSKMMAKDIPTIIVDNVVNSENIGGFVKFLNLIDVPAVVMFDEFEKNFDNDTQSHMLTMFDGLGSGNKLFVLTVNDEYKLNTFMMNRPGRIYYRFDYHGLERNFIDEYLTDTLIDKERIQETGDYIERSFKNNFTFDMLQAAVEEMNRFDIDFKEAVSCLNIDVENVTYKAIVKKDNEVVFEGKIDDLESFHIYDRKAKDHIYFEYSDNFEMYDSKTMSMVYKSGDYVADVRTERTSTRSKSFFMDAV